MLCKRGAPTSAGRPQPKPPAAAPLFGVGGGNAPLFSHVVSCLRLRRRVCLSAYLARRVALKPHATLFRRLLICLARAALGARAAAGSGGFLRLAAAAAAGR